MLIIVRVCGGLTIEMSTIQSVQFTHGMARAMCLMVWMWLGSKLTMETLALAGTEYVEMSAVMAKYNPFVEKAGMVEVVAQESPKEAVKVLQVLEKLGFSRELLVSSRHVSETLGGLSRIQVAELKSTFARFRHTRFSKSQLSFAVRYGRNV
jgi:hypothetical protein